MSKLLKLTIVVTMILLRFFGAAPTKIQVANLISDEQKHFLAKKRCTKQESKLDKIIAERGGRKILGPINIDNDQPKSVHDLQSIFDFPWQLKENTVLYSFLDILKDKTVSDGRAVETWKRLSLRSILLKEIPDDGNNLFEYKSMVLARFQYDDGSSFTNMDLKIEGKDLMLSSPTLDNPISIPIGRFFENRKSRKNCARRRQTLDWFTEAGFTFRDGRDGIIAVRKIGTMARDTLITSMRGRAYGSFEYRDPQGYRDPDGSCHDYYSDEFIPVVSTGMFSFLDTISNLLPECPKRFRR